MSWLVTYKPNQNVYKLKSAFGWFNFLQTKVSHSSTYITVKYTSNVLPSWLVPVNATDDNRSNVILLSGFGYSIGLHSFIGFNRLWSGAPCEKVHGSRPPIKIENPDATKPPYKPRLVWNEGRAFLTCLRSFQIKDDFILIQNKIINVECMYRVGRYWIVLHTFQYSFWVPSRRFVAECRTKFLLRYFQRPTFHSS